MRFFSITSYKQITSTVSSILSFLLLAGLFGIAAPHNVQAAEADLFVQPPNAVPIPALADTDGQAYVAAAGITKSIQIIPTITAGLYATGNCVGGLQTLLLAARSVTNGSGILYNIIASDSSLQVAPIDFIFFNALPTSVFVDKTTCAVAAADAAKVVGFIHLTDFVSQGTLSIGTLTGANLMFVLGKTGAVTNTTLYVVAVTRGAPTFTSTSSVIFSYKIMQD